MARDRNTSSESFVTGHVTRRQALRGVGAALGSAAVMRELPGNAAALRPAPTQTLTPAEQAEAVGPYDPSWLPDGVRSRFVHNVNGLTMHVLEAGFESAGRPALLLLHGFPELAYSWRHVMAPLADAGYHVIAPDQRGYGRTTGWSADYDGSLRPFSRLNAVRDALALVAAFGYRTVNAVIGHDFGSPVAAWSAVARPDVFRKVALMSAPFGGTPAFPFDTADDGPLSDAAGGPDIYEEMARLSRPRQHYQRYYRTREANENMWRAPQGVHDFMRAYYHHKSADWAENRPYRLDGWTAEEVAKMPTYYIMDLADGMAETVAKHMPSADHIAANTWLPDDELRVYAEEYGRTGFQGGLNHYRSGGIGAPEQQLYAGLTIDQPSIFIAGSSDWGSYQSPGNLERMQEQACTDMRGVHMVDGAGHWVQQEQPEETVRLLIEFLRGQA
jgi:pimeloyl-ACP methyl ester carboxylesterase